MKRVPGFSDYFIDKKGNVFSTRRNKGIIKMSPWIDRKGYMVVSLRNDSGQKKNMFIHRLVAITYIDNPNNYPVVNHKDRNVKNNSVNNLEWCTIDYNNKYTFTVGNKMRGNECKLFYKNGYYGTFPSEKIAAETAHNLWGSSISTLRKEKSSRGVKIVSINPEYRRVYYLFGENGLIRHFNTVLKLSQYVEDNYHCSINKSKPFNIKNKLVFSSDANFDYATFFKTKQ